MEKIKMIRSKQGSDNGIHSKLYEKGKSYKVGNSLAKSFVKNKDARHKHPRIFYKSVYFVLNRYSEIKSDLRKWYIGEPYKNDPSSMIVIIGMRRPKLAIQIDNFLKFLKLEWKWVTGFILTAIGLIIVWISMPS